MLPEKWYYPLIDCTEEELRLANEWRLNQINVGFIHDVMGIYYCLLSKHHCDNSFYYGNVENELLSEVQGDYSDYKKLTKEQFHILIGLKMNKKIIGYKLIKQEYNQAALQIAGLTSWKPTSENYKGYELHRDDCINKIKCAGVLDLWFEPVYEKAFKVGDYITCIKNGYNDSAHPDFIFKGSFSTNESTIQKIVKIEKFTGYWIAVGHLGGVAKIQKFPDAFRKSTDEEINSINKEFIIYINNQFKLRITEKGIFHKSDNITEFVKELVNHYSRFEFNKFSVDAVITFKRTGCETKPTSFEDWQDVYLKYLELCN